MNVTLKIDSLAHGGKGVSRLDDGRTAFVEGGVPGDWVNAVVTQEKDRHVIAQVVDVLEPSPDRVTPPCPYFGLCGGCQWQHVAYQAQLRAKRQIVVDAFEHIARIQDADSLVLETAPSGTPYGYRNKIELAAHTSATGLTLGFTQANSNQAVEIDSCMLLPKRAQRSPKAIRGALRYLSGTQDIGVARVGIRVASNTRDLEVALWTAPTGFPRGLAATTISQAVKASGVVRVLAKDPKHSRAISGVEVLKGKGAWRERLGGHNMLVSAPSFFQVNTPAAEKLVELSLDRLDIGSSDSVLDLYAGVGTFTVPIAQLAAYTVAVEASRHALADLARNAEQAKVDVDICGGDAAREITNLGSFDRVLVDPPRAGLSSETISALASLGASRIIYISCDPATLARDVERIQHLGYRLSEAIPVDLFPQTFHVETIAVLDVVK